MSVSDKLCMISPNPLHCTVFVYNKLLNYLNLVTFVILILLIVVKVLLILLIVVKVLLILLIVVKVLLI
jgi:hypothetical protein